MKKYKQKYKYGSALAELEGGEAVQTPEGLMEVEGASHEQGGVDMMLGMEDIVYSKRLKGEDGKTFAERKKARNSRLKKAADNLKEGSADAINRSTFEKVFGDYMEEEMQDLTVQQAANAMEEEKKGKKMKFGGFIRNVGDFLGDVGSMAVNSVAAPLGIETGLDYNTELGDFLGTISDTTGKLRGQIGGAALGGGVKMKWGGNPFASVTGTLLNYLDESKGLDNTVVNSDPQIKLGTNLTETPSYTYDDVLPPVVGKEEGRTTFKMPNQGKIGNYLQAAAPLATTLINRLGDKKEPNFFEDFGQDALRTNQEAMRLQEATRDADMQNIGTSQAGAFRRNRNRSTSLNSLNALDSLTTLSSNQAQQEANARYAQGLQGVYNRREGLFNDRDVRRMSGEAQAFQNEVANRDNFYTQMSSSLTTLGKGMQYAQLMKNKEAGLQPDVYDLLGISDLLINTKKKPD